MADPTKKTAETVKLTRVQDPIELYSSRATLGLICRPVKRIPKQDNDSVLAARSIAAKAAAEAAPAAPAEGGPKEGAQSTQPDKPSAATVAVSTGTQGEADAAIGKVLNGFRANLLTEASIIDKNTDSEDEYGPLIKMPLPEKIKDSLRVNYSTSELGFAAAGYIFGEDIAKPFVTGPGVADALVGNASYVVRTLLSGLAPSIGGLAQKSAGNIPNPFTAAIFEKVTPRKFNFSWTIQPQTPQESKNLRDVINQFRYWSLPNPSENRLILDVPYEWELSFVGTDFLYAFSRCVMTNLDIDYSPNGFNAFMIDGAPQSVTITIDFEEIYPLDKENMDRLDTTPTSMFVGLKNAVAARALDNSIANAEIQANKSKQEIAVNAAKARETAAADKLAQLQKVLEASKKLKTGVPVPGITGIEQVGPGQRARLAGEINSSIDILANARAETDSELIKLSKFGDAVDELVRTPIPSKLSENPKDYPDPQAPPKKKGG